MFGSPILDVAIGMAFIYLLLSLIASAIQELLSSLCESRSANLYNGIRSLFSGDTTLLNLLYTHGLIAGLYKNPEEDFAGVGHSSFSRLRLALQPIIGIGRIASAHDEPTNDPLHLPAYIPARAFSVALIDILNESKASGADTMWSVFQTLQSPSSTGKAYVAIRALALRAGADEQAFQTYLEDWYNDGMDRVSGWYKKYVQNVLLVVAAILAISFNVDSIRIARTLWIEPTLRQTLTSAADAYVHAPDHDPSRPTSAPVDPGQKFHDTVTAFNGLSGSLGFPVGWHHTLPYYRSLLGHPSWPTTWLVLQSAVGWLLTAFALSFGAPFWFDTLNRFMVVRGTIKPREKSSVEPAKD